MKTKNNSTLYGIFSIITFCLMMSNTYAHWSSKGPFGGRARCFLADDTLLYVGTFDGGVYRSTTAAVTAWRYANYTGLTESQINALEQYNSDVLAGTPTGIFRSADIGASWTSSSSGLTTTHILSLKRVGGTRILAGTLGGGIFKSDDGGNTWTVSNTGLTSMNVSCFAYDGTRIFAGTFGGGVHVSTDNGNTWSVVNTGLGTLNIEDLEISGGNIFAGTISGIFFSSASTVSWVTASTGLTSTTIYALTSSGGKIYAATNNGIFTSPDTAPAWTAANTGYNGPAVEVAVFNGKIYIGTDDDGLYKSNSLSSISWVGHNNGFNNLESYAIYNDGLLVIAATNKGVFVSRDLAASYVPANNGLTDSTQVMSLTFAGSDLYAATFDGGVFKSTDTGATWTPVNTGLSTLHTIAIVYRGSMNDLLVATNNGQVFQTPVSSISWTATTGLPAGISITSLTTEGFMLGMIGTAADGVFLKIGATDWTAVSTGLTTMNVRSVYIKGTVAYAGTQGGGVFRWIDPGMSAPAWTAVNTNLPTLDITAVYGQGSWILAGYKGGIYASENNGSTWYPTNVLDYIPEYADVQTISYSMASTRIFIGTPNNSLYSNSISELPTGMEVTEIKTNSGFGIYPNPSSGNFTVMLQDKNVTIERVTVFDQTGKMVYTAENVKPTNGLPMSLPLAKGIYLVNVFTSTGLLTGKLVIE